MMRALRDALGEHFAIERPLGAGAMGSVYLGRDRTLDRPVAIKVISPELAASPQARQRFLHEARTVARLRHHNIVTVYAAGDVDGLLYQVMEFVPGESLRERLERERTMEPADVARIIHDLADALGYASDQGVIHRDIKPENVLLDAETGRALMADFGVAQALSGRGEGEDGHGMTMGSPRYMSPEQAAGTRVLDGRSDLYALCLVGYEMLAGRPPFIGPGVPAVLAQQISEPPPPLAELAPDAPPALVAALERGLEKDPALRWPHASALAAALAPVLGGAETPTETEGIFSLRAHDRRYWWRVAAAGAAVMAALIGAGSWLSGAFRDASAPAAPDAHRSVLVVPFDILTADPELEWMRDGSVSMLTLDMAQWTDVQVLDYEHTLDLLRDAGLDTVPRIGLADARRLARQAGAWSVVTGQVRRSADSLFVVARLYEVESGRSLEQSEHAAPVRADPRGIFDATARSLLRIAGAPTITPELARTTTSSLAAYRDYLDGVRALNGWELERADSLLGAAVATDSTFALAHYRRAIARGWSHLPDSTDVAMAEAASRHADRLPERERALVESYLSLTQALAVTNRGNAEDALPYLTRAQAGYAGLIARDSADAEAWYGLGDAYFHAARPPARGANGAETDAEGMKELSANWTLALRAFDRALALDSTFHLAYAHKLLIYQAAGTDGTPLIVVDDSVLTFAGDTAARRYGTGRIAEARRRIRATAVAQGRQWVATDVRAPAAYSALADAYVAAGDFSQAALTLQQALAHPGVGTADMAFRVAALQMAAGDDDAFAALERALHTQNPASLASGDELRRAPALMAAATVAAYSGARGSMERLLELRTHTDPEIRALGVPASRLLPVWRATLALGMGVSDRSVRRDLEQGIAALDRIGGAAGDQARQQAAALPFTAYLRQRDPALLDVLRRWTGHEIPPELQVLATLHAGDTVRAERLAVDLPDMDADLSPLGAPPSTLRQLARAEVFIAMDNPRRALQAYEVLDRGHLATALGTADPRWPLYARSFLVRGQLHEQLGEQGEAAAAYQRFLTLWRNADPALAAPDLRAARDGLARVRSGGRRARG